MKKKLLSVAACLVLSLPARAQRQDPVPPCTCESVEGVEAVREGMTAHGKRSLQEASAAYSEALKLAPSRDANAAERALALRVAPIVFATPREPFQLKDAAAILHPNGEWIAYHLFWEDDIDFPDDNDPCDHEVVWVRVDRARGTAIEVYTYFHGRILKAGGLGSARPQVVAQWGKHGTMPWEWRNLLIEADEGDVEWRYLGSEKANSTGKLTLEAYNRATYKKLSTYGRESQESLLARGWPYRFEGSWEDFTRFTRPVDLAVVLKKNGLLRVSHFNNAALNRQLIRYNFAAKTEWPDAMCDTGLRTAAVGK